MRDITLVTAFFPINRGDWENFNRSNQQYVDYFKFWARIKNDLIVFTDKKTAKKVEEIRKEFGRTNTKLVVIDEIEKLDNVLFQKLVSVSQNQYSIDFRVRPKHPECWNAYYNYVMCLKYYFMKEAVKYSKNDLLAWIDFGYNHGGEYYAKSEEFDFLWQYDFEDKINVFQLHEIDNLPIFEVVRRMHTYFQGSLIVGDSNSWGKFWNIYRENVISSANVGLMDDDQTYVYMTYKTNPEMFNLIQAPRWHSQIDLCSDKNFTTNKEEKFGLLRKFKEKLKWKLIVGKYISKEKKSIYKDKTKM